MGWTQNVRDPKGVTPHEYFNVAYCEVRWAPLWHRLTNCVTNLFSWIFSQFLWTLFLLKGSFNNLVQCTGCLQIFKSVEEQYFFPNLCTESRNFDSDKSHLFCYLFSLVPYVYFIKVNNLLRRKRTAGATCLLRVLFEDRKPFAYHLVNIIFPVLLSFFTP
jgi:hypothetical protein